ncbi:site-specific integrase [Nitratireductor sp. XY-223]|uniref:tyrosine-type recombinase/integrase n=1 Tax=Nitratireductor sp. XY-223 TaxID=2561926 RepID=UPI0010AA5165|nr:site-specific integrase [Nitratireductor sp. XY-223]
MPDLFLTDGRALRRPIETDSFGVRTLGRLAATVEKCAITDGMPFILDDDGGYDVDLNRFFRDCPTMGVRSPNSLRAYARDILIWMRFLDERRSGKSIWEGNADDIAAFHAARRRSKPPYRISAASWNRSIAALEKFYRWALEEGIIETVPFTYRRVFRRGHGAHCPVVVSHNRAREPGARQSDMRFIGLDKFTMFRDVGLRGRLPDGSEDPSWRGRHGERNALFAELLLTTGMRLAEAAHLLHCELPTAAACQDAEQRLFLFRLPAAITKGNKARRIRLPLRIMLRLHDYAALERANAVERIAERSKVHATTDALIAVDADHKTIVIAGEDGQRKRMRLDLVAPRERQRLFIVDGGGVSPAMLWLTETGAAMTPWAWAGVFRRASARCRAFGIDIEVTPHMLRHSFAVNMLSMLIRTQIGMVVQDGSVSAAGAAAYRRMIGDPLQKLQRLMGHASIISTHIYLSSLDESRAIVDAAINDWAGASGREETVP